MNHEKKQEKNDEIIAADNTKMEFKRKFYEQEHRLIPAVYNFFFVFFSDSSENRKYYLPSVAKALFWCLLPSPGTASVGILAVLTLLVAVHQSTLLQSQNNKIEIQNILAEAERRSTLMFETVAIFEQIEKEKERIDKLTDDKKRFCRGKSYIGPCWIVQTDAKGISSNRSLFVPSAATVGRLAALTQALRPYRYLQVEGAEKGLCPLETASPALDSTYQALLGESFKQAPGRARGDVPNDIALSITKEIYKDYNFQSKNKRSNLINNLIQQIIGTNDNINASLNCGPSSPERGQLLVSLHAAGVDISAIQNGGGNFTYADIPGANLSGIKLNGVRLNNARLPGASFANADLYNVHLRGADINGARFAGAKLEKVDFEGARIQIFEKVGDAPLYFLPPKANDVLISGIRIFEKSLSPNILDRICFSFSLPSAYTLESEKVNIAASTLGELEFFDLSDYGILIETRVLPNDLVKEQRAILMFGIGLPRTKLYEGESTKIEYIPVSDCN